MKNEFEFIMPTKWILDFAFDTEPYPKTAPPIKGRKTATKKIKTLNKTVPQKAAQLAAVGRELSPIENLVASTLLNYRCSRINRPHRTKSEQKFLESFFRNEYVESGNAIASEFMAALVSVDSSKIFEIAKAVAYFKANPPWIIKDPIRAYLLWDKSIEEMMIADGDKKNTTLRTVAKRLYMLGVFKKFPDSNGMRTLRRICEEINYPITSIGQIKKK